MMQLNKVRRQTVYAARVVSELPVDQRAQWVAYLLESLDGIADEREERDEWDVYLNLFFDDLATRLETGRW